MTIIKAHTTGKITVFYVDGKEAARIQQGRPGIHNPAFHAILDGVWVDCDSYPEAEERAMEYLRLTKEV
ncbi:MAG: hypothetical protein IKG69_08680 [Atopobiaceae bacterium]|nr:hypothetical protein [Atopobiaceae bacterium]